MERGRISIYWIIQRMLFHQNLKAMYVLDRNRRDGNVSQLDSSRSSQYCGWTVAVLLCREAGEAGRSQLNFARMAAGGFLLLPNGSAMHFKDSGQGSNRNTF